MHSFCPFVFANLNNDLLRDSIGNADYQKVLESLENGIDPNIRFNGSSFIPGATGESVYSQGVHDTYLPLTPLPLALLVRNQLRVQLRKLETVQTPIETQNKYTEIKRIIRILLQKGADPNHINSDDRIMQTNDVQVSIVPSTPKQLLHSSPLRISMDDMDGNSDDLEILKLLMQSGADPGKRAHDMTALEQAVKEGQLAVVKVLLSQASPSVDVFKAIHTYRLGIICVNNQSETTFDCYQTLFEHGAHYTAHFPPVVLCDFPQLEKRLIRSSLKRYCGRREDIELAASILYAVAQVSRKFNLPPYVVLHLVDSSSLDTIRKYLITLFLQEMNVQYSILKRAKPFFSEILKILLQHIKEDVMLSYAKKYTRTHDLLKNATRLLKQAPKTP